jgi:hypothetical protein
MALKALPFLSQHLKAVYFIEITTLNFFKMVLSTISMKMDILMPEFIV